MKERIFLAADKVSPRQARQWVSTRCGVDPDTIFTAELLVSELVSNAVVHAHSEMVLTLDRGLRCLHVEVEDHGIDMVRGPRRGGPTPRGASGRGLKIVSALASSWGIRPTEQGKSIWFEIPIGTEGPPQVPDA